jgi:hypothetical protein
MRQLESPARFFQIRFLAVADRFKTRLAIELSRLKDGGVARKGIL